MGRIRSWRLTPGTGTTPGTSSGDGGSERIATLRNEMHEAMEGGTGIFRDEKSLTDTCRKIAELRDRFKIVRIDDHTNSFNTDLTAALELG
ncbi:MAG: hypothetical protein IIA33_08715, partial [Planctomycetes bacterium]|nr:hypothetical protein [Planctomycetota bacterium]